MIYITKEKCENNKKSHHAAGLCCRDRLFSLLGISEDVFLTENGRPYIKNETVDFSISHSGELAVCAVICDKQIASAENVTVLPHSGRQIGIDLELMDRTKDTEKLCKIAKRCIGVETTDADNFYNCWTRHEAFGKLCGEGVIHRASDEGCTYLPSTLAENSKEYAFCICYK